MTGEPSFYGIVQAADRIQTFISQTPLLQSNSIDELTGARCFFKCENLQKAGAFKMRGAANAVFGLPPELVAAGVATHSSGNHAAALARAARLRGIPAYIVMPSTAPEIKQQAVCAFGGQITYCQPTLEDRERTLQQVQEMTGACFIHPYDNPDVICGQGTVALEMLQTQPDLETIIAPVGGGGLISGTLLLVRGTARRLQVFGAEPLLADDAKRSLQTGILQPAIPTTTIADGLRTALSPRTFEIIRHHIDDILTVTEESIERALGLIWDRLKLVAEPSGAVPLAAVLQYPDLFAGKKTGLIISGGNVQIRNKTEEIRQKK